VAFPAALRTRTTLKDLRFSGRRSAAAMVVGGIVSVQLGGALALTLFDELSPSGMALVRLVVAALVMGAWVVASRGKRGFVVSLPIVLLGVDLAIRNLVFYAAIGRIPLGPAVALEFLGPLSVALALSRRPRDVFVALVALAGVLVRRPIGGSLDPVGVGFALASGATWAAYILLIRRIGDETY
jgi:inner membrane transporter RhtA